MSPNTLDQNGQPFNRLYNRKRLNDRAIDELIGMSRGILADGIVNQKEAEFLQQWMEANVSFCEDRIVNQLYRRLQEMLIDGNLDKEEQVELFDILSMYTGENKPGEIATNTSTALPFDQPPPNIEFPTMSFCLTGKFAYGPRRVCHEVIEERGGKICKKVSLDVDYLVVGYFGSKDWIHTPYGRKIERAAELRDDGNDIAIISEKLWADTAFGGW